MPHPYLELEQLLSLLSQRSLTERGLHILPQLVHILATGTDSGRCGCNCCVLFLTGRTGTELPWSNTTEIQAAVAILEPQSLYLLLPFERLSLVEKLSLILRGREEDRRMLSPSSAPAVANGQEDYDARAALYERVCRCSHAEL
jgi:hypothetical protein